MNDIPDDLLKRAQAAREKASAMIDRPADVRPDDDIKRLDIGDFRDAGYLQEANRRFFHPLGLALEVLQDADGSVHLGGIWDYRDDPEGMRFRSDVLATPEAAARADRVDTEMDAKLDARIALLGGLIQRIGGHVERS